MQHKIQISLCIDVTVISLDLFFNLRLFYLYLFNMKLIEIIV